METLAMTGLQVWSSSTAAVDRPSVAPTLLLVSWCRAVGRVVVLGELRLEPCAEDEPETSQPVFCEPKTCQLS